MQKVLNPVRSYSCLKPWIKWTGDREKGIVVYNSPGTEGFQRHEEVFSALKFSQNLIPDRQSILYHVNHTINTCIKSMRLTNTNL